MTRSRTALVAVGLVLAFGLAGCSSSGDTTNLDPVAQAQIDGLQARVTSLESRVTWLEVVGRKAIEAAPTKYTEQLTTDVAALQADMATAQANAAAVAEQVATEKAAAEKAIADAKAAVDAAVAAESAEDAARVAAIEAARAAGGRGEGGPGGLQAEASGRSRVQVAQRHGEPDQLLAARRGRSPRSSSGRPTWRERAPVP